MQWSYLYPCPLSVHSSTYWCKTQDCKFWRIFPRITAVWRDSILEQGALAVATHSFLGCPLSPSDQTRSSCFFSFYLSYRKERSWYLSTRSIKDCFLATGHFIYFIILGVGVELFIFHIGYFFRKQHIEFPRITGWSPSLLWWVVEAVPGLPGVWKKDGWSFLSFVMNSWSSIELNVSL